ncbi:MAG: AAA family ATPase [Acidobacteria bacterium]|nr:AAA family ATPase [Acidobacteriota bacterium]
MSGMVVTFYSYKGGVGRSMALANVARLLANAGKRVLAIDWDLDAPGLHRYFPTADLVAPRKPGLIDYFVALRRHLDDGCESPKLQDFVVPDAAPQVDLMRAGMLDETYRRTVLEFDWAGLHSRHPQAVTLFRAAVKQHYSICLIDSRAGIADISGICTALLPEKLVTVFTPNKQNLDGLMETLGIVAEYRRQSADTRPLTIYPLPSRIDPAEQDALHSWLMTFRLHFQDLFKRIYALEECDLGAYFDAVRLPQVAYYSYGEQIAVLEEERSQAGSLRQAYEIFTAKLTKMDFPWQE